MQNLVELLTRPITHPPVSTGHPSLGFYPSQASIELENEYGETEIHGGCLRQQYYAMSEVPPSEPSDPQQAMKAYFGTTIHESLVEASKLAGIYLADEFRVYIHGPPSLSGRGDLMVMDPNSGKPVGVEIKTTFGYQGEKGVINTRGGAELRPKLDHVLQAFIYLNYFSQFGVEEWIILYVSRGSGAMRQHSISITEEGYPAIRNIEDAYTLEDVTYDKIVSRWKKLEQYTKDREIPPRDYEIQYSDETIMKMFERNEISKTDKAKVTSARRREKSPLLEKGSWRCQYCSYSSLCWGTEWPAGFEHPTQKRIINPLAQAAQVIKSERETPVTEVFNPDQF